MNTKEALNFEAARDHGGIGEHRARKAIQEQLQGGNMQQDKWSITDVSSRKTDSIHAHTARAFSEERLETAQAIADRLPEGSGFDAHWDVMQLDSNKFQCSTEYHFMDQYGMYRAWIDTIVVVKAADASEVEVLTVHSFPPEDLREDEACASAFEGFDDYVGDTVAFRLSES